MTTQNRQPVLRCVLSNAAHPEYGQVTIPFPIPVIEYECTLECLAAMELGARLKRDCRVDELESGFPILKRLEKVGANLDELDYLARRLDSFDDYSFGGTALVGDPTDPDILKQGGVENCDAVAAVSEDDSVNLMAAQIAKNIFRREKVICRVSDPHLQVLYHKAYELDTICPTILTEQAVFRALAK